RKIGYARGLFLNSSPFGKSIGHTGGSAGYGSIITRIPEHRISIAIMCNSGEMGDRGAFARRIYALLIPVAQAPPNAIVVPDSSGAATTDLNSKAGSFFNDGTGEWMRLSVNNGKLKIADGPAMITVGKDLFKTPNAALPFMSGDEFELQFSSNDNFQYKSMEGRVTMYRRAKSFTPNMDQLKEFAGRYESDEIGAIFKIEPKEDGLQLHLEHAPEKNLKCLPIDTDTFQAGRMMVRFRRDKSGKVIGMNYSNPLLRKINFTRLAR
ncbi:MAG: DUF3471 domain-containing protein, partial [Chitinophagaceae bacterium]|nr:DUF3471 domain-containing protein [Chitinophagaceae bacterium]